MADGPWKVTIEEITPAEFWANGYDYGYDDGARGRPHLVNGPWADVIPIHPPAGAPMDHTPPLGTSDLFGDLFG